MKREIKFRVWDKEDKQMSLVYQIGGDVVLFNHNVIGAEYASTLKERFEWLQFTGLKDKNGVDIYEGDLLAPKHWCEYLQVMWCLNSLEWKSVTTCGRTWLLTLYNKSTIEVVGTAFENSEYLAKPHFTDIVPIRSGLLKI